MAKRKRAKGDDTPCDCEGCQYRRAMAAHAIEVNIWEGMEVRRKSGRPLLPPLPQQNAPSTMMLQ